MGGAADFAYGETNCQALAQDNPQHAVDNAANIHLFSEAIVTAGLGTNDTQQECYPLVSPVGAEYAQCFHAQSNHTCDMQCRMGYVQQGNATRVCNGTTWEWSGEALVCELHVPDCSGNLEWLADSYCDAGLNNEQCAYDGGDCCEETCMGANCNSHPSYPYNCIDPAVANNTNTPPPTNTSVPTPAQTDGPCEPSSWVGDGICDVHLNNEQCAYDGGDCCEETCGNHTACGDAYPYNCIDPEVANTTHTPRPTNTFAPTPTPSQTEGPCEPAMWVGDGLCDTSLNNEQCNYDGGDCCEETCSHVSCGADTANYPYNCIDPEVANTTHTPRPTNTSAPTPTPSQTEGSCEPAMWLGDGLCDPILNYEQCDYDGGDCCEETCEGASCGQDLVNFPFRCVDPAVANTTHTPTATPSPTRTHTPTPWQTGPCEPTEWIGDGYCDTGLNNEECAYDGGDCCEETCGEPEACGSPSYPFDCKDPAVANTTRAPTSAPTPASTPTHTAFEGTLRPGSGPATHALACQVKCDADALCVAHSFWASASWCSLLQEVVAVLPAVDAVSGFGAPQCNITHENKVYDAAAPHTDFLSYLLFPPGPHESECCEACVSHYACAAFSHTISGRCVLFSAVDDSLLIATAADSHSGVVDGR